MTRFRCTLFVAFGVVLVPLVGCGEPQASLSGKVTFKNKPVTGGWVIFINEAEKHDRAQIKPDGTYSSTTVPIGNLKVGVEPAAKGVSANMPKGVKKPEIPKDGPADVYAQGSGGYVDIPMYLRSPNTSKITTKVEAGAKTFDIDLPDK
jgi:hypothetical protein